MTEEIQRLAAEVEEVVGALAEMQFQHDLYMQTEDMSHADRAERALKHARSRRPLQDRLKELQDKLARLRDEALHREQLVADAEQRAQVDDANFWFRRFNTSLAIAHGAGFAAIGSKLFDKETPPDIIVAAWHPMAIFALGMVAAGVLPIALYFRRQLLAWSLAGASATLFAAGLVAALVAMWLRAAMVWPWQL